MKAHGISGKSKCHFMVYSVDILDGVDSTPSSMSAARPSQQVVHISYLTLI